MKHIDKLALTKIAMVETTSKQANGAQLNALLPYLVGGGSGALLGGLYGGLREKDEEDSRLMSILQGAGLGGGVGLAGGGIYDLLRRMKSTPAPAAKDPPPVTPDEAMAMSESTSSNPLNHTPATAAGPVKKSPSTPSGEQANSIETDAAKDTKRLADSVKTPENPGPIVRESETAALAAAGDKNSKGTPSEPPSVALKPDSTPKPQADSETQNETDKLLEDIKKIPPAGTEPFPPAAPAPPEPELFQGV